MSGHSYHLLLSPMGWVGLMGADKGLSRLTIKPTPQEALEELGPGLEGATHDPDAFPQAQGCLDRYFRGDVKALDEIRVDLTWAPPFFRAAWAACRQIPPGETRSYAWLAAQAGNPRAARAAGQAMARNPLALVIPCHRVIASNGGLHGYGAGGLGVKAQLLVLEGACVAQVGVGTGCPSFPRLRGKVRIQRGCRQTGVLPARSPKGRSSGPWAR